MADLYEQIREIKRAKLEQEKLEAKRFNEARLQRRHDHFASERESVEYLMNRIVGEFITEDAILAAFKSGQPLYRFCLTDTLDHVMRCRFQSPLLALTFECEPEPTTGWGSRHYERKADLYHHNVMREDFSLGVYLAGMRDRGFMTDTQAEYYWANLDRPDHDRILSHMWITIDCPVN